MQDIQQKNDLLFIQIALLAKTRSYQDNPTGGVLIKDNTLMTVAWNGTLPGAKNICPSSEPQFSEVIHTTQNLIARAAKQGLVTEGSSVYLTEPPCLPCALLLAQAGVSKVVIPSKATSLALSKLQTAGVEVVCYEL